MGFHFFAVAYSHKNSRSDIVVPSCGQKQALRILEDTLNRQSPTTRTFECFFFIIISLISDDVVPFLHHFMMMETPVSK